MKKIYVVLVLISGFAYGQEAPGPRVLSGTARYKLTVSGDMGRGEDACGDIDGLKEIQLYDANNGNDFSKLWEGRMINESFSKTRDYHDDNRIVKVKLKKVIRWQIYTFPTGYSCDGGPDDRYNEVDITSGDFSFSLQAAGDGLSNLKVTSRPIVNLSSTNPDDNLLGTNTRLEIPAIAGVAPEYYKWQYHIDGEKVGSGIRRRDRWRLLPNQYQNLNYLTITACSNVLPREAVGKKIWLRANSYSPTLNFTYVQSAPHILSATGIPTSCSNTKDGKVRVVFDSALKQGESLYFSIKNKDIGDAPYSTKDITALEPDNSYVISFPDLKSYGGKGSYTIQILGRYNNGKGSEAILYSMDPEHSATFDISSPDPVDF